MNDREEGVLIGLGISAALLFGGWLALRANWRSVRKTIADSVQAQVMGELRGEPLLYQGLDTLTRTITVAAGGAGASMGLEGIIYEKLSGKVADGIGDAVKIRS